MECVEVQEGFGPSCLGSVLRFSFNTGLNRYVLMWLMTAYLSKTADLLLISPFGDVASQVRQVSTTIQKIFT